MVVYSVQCFEKYVLWSADIVPSCLCFVLCWAEWLLMKRVVRSSSLGVCPFGFFTVNSLTRSFRTGAVDAMLDILAQNPNNPEVQAAINKYRFLPCLNDDRA